MTRPNASLCPSAKLCVLCVQFPEHFTKERTFNDEIVRNVNPGDTLNPAMCQKPNLGKQKEEVNVMNLVQVNPNG